MSSAEDTDLQEKIIQFLKGGKTADLKERQKLEKQIARYKRRAEEMREEIDDINESSKSIISRMEEDVYLKHLINLQKNDLSHTRKISALEKEVKEAKEVDCKEDILTFTLQIESLKKEREETNSKLVEDYHREKLQSDAQFQTVLIKNVLELKVKELEMSNLNLIDINKRTLQEAENERSNYLALIQAKDEEISKLKLQANNSEIKLLQDKNQVLQDNKELELKLLQEKNQLELKVKELEMSNLNHEKGHQRPVSNLVYTREEATKDFNIGSFSGDIMSVMTRHDNNVLTFEASLADFEETELIRPKKVLKNNNGKIIKSKIINDSSDDEHDTSSVLPEMKLSSVTVSNSPQGKKTSRNRIIQ